MSNTLLDNESNASEVVERVDDLAGAIASKPSEELKSTAASSGFKVKPKISVEIPNPKVEEPAEAVIKAATKQQEAFRVNAENASNKVTDGVAHFDSLKIKKPTNVDFSHVTEDDVYNLDIPMEARPFSSEDSLKVVLVDSGYVARWVNKDPRRLGAMIARGFTYVTAKDLAERLEVEVSADAEGHFCLGDVILMKVSKSYYYPAMRAAHLRSIISIGAKGAHKAALANVNNYMTKETGGAYNEEAEAGKIAFYSPNLSI
jgi:hypothetical protein